MFKRALVSVSDKTGLIDFLKPLALAGMEIVSTGGTAQSLREAGLRVIDISEVTGFPEVLDGRVKTLHPHVHMGLLAQWENPEHRKILKDFNVQPFDLVVCNLYPFAKTLQQLGSAQLPPLIEKIDVGGPTMLRAAAKNFATITVVCDPADYTRVLENKFQRQELAAKVFQHVSEYDGLIAKTLSSTKAHESSTFQVDGNLQQSLRYGENPQQKAWWMSWKGSTNGLQKARILQGKELSYNNLLDIEASLQLVRTFQKPAVVAVKHNNPCGVAQDSKAIVALQKALQADPVSVFGGIVALNSRVDAAHAELLKGLFLECILAPAIDEEALKILSAKKNLRVLVWPEMLQFSENLEYRSLSGGFLVQEKDSMSSSVEQWKIMGPSLSEEQKLDLIFGEKVCASLKSNAIAVIYRGQTLGLGMGQVNRVDAVEQALSRWKKHHSHIEAPYLVSDAFFPFRDSVDLIAQSGVKVVLQPGGSMKDEEVFQASQEKGLTMVVTGLRHFRH